MSGKTIPDSLVIAPPSIAHSGAWPQPLIAIAAQKKTSASPIGNALVCLTIQCARKLLLSPRAGAAAGEGGDPFVLAAAVAAAWPPPFVISTPASE